MNDNILRHEENGIEFFTLVDSGNSGISQTGIARLCGKSRQAIIKLEKTLVTKTPSKWLKDFVGKDLTLVTKVSTSDKKVRNATIYTAGFCAAVIKHYAYQGSEIAQESDFAIGEIGLTSYIQAKTGWLPEQNSQNYHYQHFCPELDDSLLKTHIRDVYNLMCIAQSQKHFWQLMSDRFGEGIQLDLGIE